MVGLREDRGDNELRRAIRAAAVEHLIHLPDQMGVYPGIKNSLDHSEVLEIVVRLEEGIAGEELDKDAA